MMLNRFAELTPLQEYLAERPGFEPGTEVLPL
jgi:hypothetical protein